MGDSGSSIPGRWPAARAHRSFVTSVAFIGYNGATTRPWRGGGDGADARQSESRRPGRARRDARPHPPPRNCTRSCGWRRPCTSAAPPTRWASHARRCPNASAGSRTAGRGAVRAQHPTGHPDRGRRRPAAARPRGHRRPGRGPPALGGARGGAPDIVRVGRGGLRVRPGGEPPPGRALSRAAPRRGAAAFEMHGTPQGFLSSGADIAFVRSPMVDPRLRVVALAHEPRGLIGHRANPAAGDDRADLGRMLDEVFVAIAPQDPVTCDYWSGAEVRAGRPARLAGAANSTLEVLYAVSYFDQVTTGTPAAVEATGMPGLCFLPSDELSPVRLGVAVRADERRARCCSSWRPRSSWPSPSRRPPRGLRPAPTRTATRVRPSRAGSVRRAGSRACAACCSRSAGCARG